MISILGDEVKRAVYDQTGSVDDAVSQAIFVVFVEVHTVHIMYKSLSISVTLMFVLLYLPGSSAQCFARTPSLIHTVSKISSMRPLQRVRLLSFSLCFTNSLLKEKNA